MRVRVRVRDRGVRMVGVVVGVVLVLASGACAGSDTGSTTGTTGTTVPRETTTLPETPVDQGKQIYTYTPEVGDCFDKRKVPGVNGSKQQDIILKLDCQLPHVNEVFAVIEAPWPDKTDRTYPGDDVLRKFAKTDCPKEFEAYVGTKYELSKLEIAYLLPTESNWPTARTVGCYVFTGNETRVEGSVKATKS